MKRVWKRDIKKNWGNRHFGLLHTWHIRHLNLVANLMANPFAAYGIEFRWKTAPIDHPIMQNPANPAESETTYRQTASRSLHRVATVARSRGTRNLQWFGGGGAKCGSKRYWMFWGGRTRSSVAMHTASKRCGLKVHSALFQGEPESQLAQGGRPEE